MQPTTFKHLFILSLLALSACQSTSQSSPDTQEATPLSPVQAALADDTFTNQPELSQLSQLPPAVAQALQANTQASQNLYGGNKYDVDAIAVDAKAFFNSLVQDTPYSVAVHPEVNGQISVNLKQVELAQIFDVVSQLYGYDIRRQGSIFQVFPAGMRTETFTINYLLMQRMGLTQTSIQSGGVSQENNNNNGNFNGNVNNFSGNSANANGLGLGGALGGLNGIGVNGTNISTITDTNFWTDLEETLQTLIGTEDGRSVITTPQAGLVTVRAWPDEIRAVKHFLKISEENLQRQVILEARIVEVSLSDDYQQGINWTQVLANSGDTDFQFSTQANALGNDISASLGGITSLAFVNQDFSGVLSLLSSQGNVQVLSSPRVTATNNQKAVIKVGDDEYFVTDVSSDSTITAGATQVTPNIELTPFFSGIALDVTPQIDDEGQVLLHVHPSVIETVEQEKLITVNQEQFVLPLAQSNIRESDTVIRARSGEIVVIGGLMQTTISETDSKTPLLGSIPILGELFKQRRDSEIKRELVILLKPTVVGQDTWRKHLNNTRKQMAQWLYVDE